MKARLFLVAVLGLASTAAMESKSDSVMPSLTQSPDNYNSYPSSDGDNAPAKFGSIKRQHECCIEKANAHFRSDQFHVHVAPRETDHKGDFFHSITQGLTGLTNGGYESAAGNPYSRAALVAHLQSLSPENRDKLTEKVAKLYKGANSAKVAEIREPPYPGDKANGKLTSAGWTSYLNDLKHYEWKWVGEWEAATEAVWHNIEIVLIDPDKNLFKRFNQGAAHRVVVCRVNENHFDAMVDINGGAHHGAAPAAPVDKRLRNNGEYRDFHLMLHEAEKRNARTCSLPSSYSQNGLYYVSKKRLQGAL